ncbi:hypothetical protein FA95DRAFT_1676011 [Auriscalpium vulgare]|uniref:Uncharacterized protein n=1 Tax=Auriscalpium vulgare TaxID=40419 RepID=A0ACB8S5V5_9AGAM|nr:hypothetical protein FA95DRAFT_1676011 [Auriscalpium vulgare]
MASFLPTLSPLDVQRAAQLIQQSYNPSPIQRLSPEEQRRLNNDLFDLQKKWEAWGLVVPFLEHEDANVQFFGAHTAQVKIARDWETFPPDRTEELRAFLLDITARCVRLGRSKVILRKLFVALCSLAIKLGTQWEDWLLSSVGAVSGPGIPTEHALDFLEIAVEEVHGADLLPPKKAQMQQILQDAVPLVTQAITASLVPSEDPAAVKQFTSAIKCLESWIPILPSSDLTPLIQNLWVLLNPVSPPHFLATTSALLTILSSSAFTGGAGARTLTEPLLLWTARFGPSIVSETLSTGMVDEVSNGLCRLLVGLGDHSAAYLAENIASSTALAPAVLPVPLPSDEALPPRSHVVQTFLKLLLAYTSLPGFYGVDEEESEMTLGFWYEFQEALWNVEVPDDTDDDGVRQEDGKERDLWVVAKAVYAELVAALRTKVQWPAAPTGWAKDQLDKFQVYRRDIGDTLINAYYVLRDDMLAYYVNDITERLSNRSQESGWEDVEATLHCVMSIQESVPVDPNEHLARLFSADILGRLPTTGTDRVRRTTLSLIGSYASWFTTLPTSSPALLMNVLTYVVAALPEPALCLQAANALRDLCDANRTALAPHISAFGELHAGLVGVPDTEKAKVLQSIASVIQALPPAEEIPPVEAIVAPVVARLFQALQSSSQLPDESRALAFQQLQTLTGVAKGLTRAAELGGLDDPPALEETERMQRARDDPRMLRVREDMVNALRGTVELWSTDAGISDALSDLFKSITALAADATLISLPPAPLLELVCRAAQRQLTALWLALATILVVQLNPPALASVALRATPSAETLDIVQNVTRALLDIALPVLGGAGYLEANPDVVQDFFHYMEKVAFQFVVVLYRLPRPLFNALVRCAVTALALQERYSLVSSSTFLSTLISRTHASGDLGDAKDVLVQTHGPAIMHAVLAGFAGVAPKSTVLNIVEVFSMLVMKYPAESRVWMSQILYGEEFVQSKAGPEAKAALVQAVFGTRSLKKTKEAVQQFTIIARGQEGSSFGAAW